ncbi:glutathione peroxidase [Sphingomonas flavalba]|uniref:glutathione peroxidase n=1 Tax=Sphingomonas flavalba TaxID=2559804 RepID=UPI00109DBA6D|nr:glutathione peroxidase [Sphingomonas flavalba]
MFAFRPALPGGGTGALAAYAGKVLLIVNVASRCGFTPQYAGLEALYRRYADRGFVVLGFPCNQFGEQEPGSDTEIAAFCAATYDVTFPLFAKVAVNGPGADPLWAWLQAERRGFAGIRAIKWNFTKFLVGRDGAVVARYAPMTKPAAIAAAIEALL